PIWTPCIPEIAANRLAVQAHHYRDASDRLPVRVQLPHPLIALHSLGALDLTCLLEARQRGWFKRRSKGGLRGWVERGDFFTEKPRRKRCQSLLDGARRAFEKAFDRLAQVLQQMPTIGHLLGLRRRRAGSLSIDS